MKHFIKNTLDLILYAFPQHKHGHILQCKHGMAVFESPTILIPIQLCMNVLAGITKLPQHYLQNRCSTNYVSTYKGKKKIVYAH